MKIYPERNVNSQYRYGFFSENHPGYRLKNLFESWPLLAVLLIFSLVSDLNIYSLLPCLLVCSLVAIGIEQIGRQNVLSRKSIVFIQLFVLTFIVTGFCWGYLAEPVQAQFFRKAEDFFRFNLTQGLEGGSGTVAAVSLVFNVLRAIYLLYIAISLIGVVNSIRKDEDWQTVIRTPLLVVVAVTIADVLTGFVVGNS